MSGVGRGAGKSASRGRLRRLDGSPLTSPNTLSSSRLPPSITTTPVIVPTPNTTIPTPDVVIPTPHTINPSHPTSNILSSSSPSMAPTINPPHTHSNDSPATSSAVQNASVPQEVKKTLMLDGDG